jgi:hypothetical protein
MTEDVTLSSVSEEGKRILADHLKIGPEKPVSYLPIKTIERVIGVTVSDYRSMIEATGNDCLVSSVEDCCINSGAVYAYSDKDLHSILKDNYNILSKYGLSVLTKDVNSS